MTDNKELTAAQMLLDARTNGRRKREISTIAKLLCIREEYLTALEQGDYNAIPEVVYILGFARNYAMELGLDPDEVVAKIKKELKLVDDCNPTLPDDDEDVKEPVAPQKKQKNIKKDFFGKASKYIYKHWKWLLGAAAALIIVIAGVALVVSLGGGTDTTNSEEITASIVPEPEYKTEVRERFGTENRATAKVIVQATKETWVKIEDARGNTVFSRVLVAGDVYYVPDGDKYKGTFGNAGGVDIWVNGSLAPKLGAMNVRKSGILMTPEGLNPTYGEVPEQQ